MKAERLFLDHTVRETVRAERKKQRPDRSPDQVLCDLLNRLTPERREAVAHKLR